MGATLAAQLTRLGHQVAIANSRGPRTFAGVAARTGAAPVPVTEVTSKADVVIVAIREKSVPELPAGLLSSLPGGTVVIDTGTTSRSSGTDTSTPSTPACPKANGCNHSYAARWSRRSHHPPGEPGQPRQTAGAAGRTVIPVAGDDPAAKSVVLEPADQLGFDGLDAGPLAESWRQQPGTPVYTTDLPSTPPGRPWRTRPRADRRMAQPAPTAQKAGYSHAPKQPHRRALRPGQPVRPQPPGRVQ
jgi:predicted dinucleotide-binding enzyme